MIDLVVLVIVWFLGVKIYNGVLGVDVFGKDYVILLELVKKVGKVIGNVLIVEL